MLDLLLLFLPVLFLLSSLKGPFGHLLVIDLPVLVNAIVDTLLSFVADSCRLRLSFIDHFFVFADFLAALDALLQQQ